jgi:type I restriction enzyme, S subunit
MSWIESQLGDLIEIKHGYAFKGEYFSNEGKYIVLTPGNCHEKGGLKLKGDKEKYYLGDIPEDYLLSEGDLLVVMTDLVNTAPMLGGAFLIPEDDCFLHNQRLGLVGIKDTSKIDNGFLFHLLNTNNYRGQVRGSASGATVRHTAPGRIKACKVVIPEDVKEQRKIAEILGCYDDLIENNRRRIQLLEESARLLYKEWFVQLRFPGHEHVNIIDGVPEGWESGAVIDFYKTSSGGTPSRKNLDFYTGDFNWVKTGELLDSFIFTTEEKITEEAISQSSAKIFPSGSVLVAMYGATIGRTGILALPSASNQACCALTPNHELAHYIHAYLFLMENKAGLINLAKGAAQNNINQDIIKTYPMIMPPKRLMDVFYLSIKDSFEQLRNLQQQNTKLAQARDLLLPRLMNGTLTV